MSLGKFGFCLTLLFLSFASHGAAPNEDFQDALWAVESHGVLKIAAADGAVDITLDSAEEVRAVAVDAVSGRVWVARAGELTAYSFDGQKEHVIQLDSRDFKSNRVALSVDRRDGSIWLARGRSLDVFAFDGAPIDSARLGRSVRALSLASESGKRWIASKQEVSLRDDQGDILQSVTLKRGEKVSDVAHQPGSDALWIVTNKRIGYYDLQAQGFSWSRQERNLKRIRVLGDETAWVAGQRQLLLLDREGSVTESFGYSQPGTLVDFVVDPLEGSLWLATRQHLRRYRPDGAVVDEHAFTGSGHEGRLWSLALYVDDIPPTLAFAEPTSGILTNDSFLPFELDYDDTGIGADPGSLDFKVEETTAPFECDQVDDTSSRCVPMDGLPEGENQVEATIADFNFNRSEPASVDIVVDTIPPEFLELSPENGSEVSSSPVAVSGQLSEPAELAINGKAVVHDAELRFDEEVELTSGPNAIELDAADPAGNSMHEKLSIELELATEDLPPNPEDVAPDLPPAVVTPFHERNEFLYAGDDPIQRDADPEAIEPERAAIVRGKVLDRSGQPLPGVRVRILDHPEYGFTLSRQDGEFDLAVNGGGSVVVDFELDGHLPIQRKVKVPWNKYIYVDEVSLIELDDRVTVVDLTNESAGMQVARGSLEQDADGNRQATVLFPEGTQAEAVLESGESIALDQLSFRATEYTVGERGLAMMPGDLPDNVGYTYAVELSVDEALAQGASEVRFDRGVPLYVENFLEFPTGTGVPVAFYDRDRGQWIAHENGAVIEIVDKVDGKAVLDVTGDGAATSGLLDELSITNAERARLAELYSVGDSLQRALLHHFSPWDLNYPFGPPPGAEEPPAQDDPLEDIPDEEKDECDGCTINPQGRVLGEDIPIPGTSFTLNYKSDRQPGYLRDRRIEIPITDDSVHPELLRIEATVIVAGKKIQKTFNPEPNQSWIFEWDGKSVRGRTVKGPASISISVANVYPMLYKVPSGWRNNPLWGAAPTEIEVNENRRFTYGETRLERSSQSEIYGGNGTLLPTSSELGGWTLSDHHLLHGLQGSRPSVVKGGGKTVGVGAGSDIIRTVAGGGSREPSAGMLAVQASLRPLDVAIAPDGALHFINWGSSRVWRVDSAGRLEVAAGNGRYEYSGDGGPAVEAGLKGPEGISFAEDGSLLIVDGGDNRVRRVSPEGIIETVAGNGNYGSNGDGGPALDAEFAWPWDVEQAPDGSMFIADPNNNRIRRVGTDDQIDTLIGGDEWDFGGDGGPAADALIDFPQSISYSSFGSLVFTDASYRIREVGKDGIVRTLAGSGVSGDGGDGGPAVDAEMGWPTSVVVSPEGIIYFSEEGWVDERIRRVSADGVITTIAGGLKGFSGDGGPPGEAQINGVSGLALHADGSLYLADYGNDRVRKITPAIRLTDKGNRVVPSRDRGEVYYFNPEGQHLETRNALTNGVLWEFSYNDENALIEIIDGDGNTTRIERDATGLAKAIIAPDGQRTELIIDGNDRLTAVEDPEGGKWQIEYDSGGLLSAFTDRSGFRTEYFYNDSGEFLASIDARGGGWSVEAQSSDDREITKMTTAEGRVYSFEVEALPTEERKHIRTDPAGLETKRVVTPGHGRTAMTLPDGTEVVSREGPDPRFEMASPIPAFRSVELPSGLTFEATTSRESELEDLSDPLSISQQMDQITTNGRTSTVEFDADQPEWSVRSPVGRQSTVEVNQKGRPLQMTLGNLAPIHYQYDERGRPASVSVSNGPAERRYEFDYHSEGDQAGYLAEITDPSARTTRFEYDAVGRVTRQTYPGGRSVDFTYDAEGRLKSLTPPGRSAHVFEYNGPGDRERYEPPELTGVDSITTYRYNLDRQPTEIERPGGEVVSFNYDSGGRLDSISSDVGIVNYAYRPDTGQLASISSPDDIELTLDWDGFLPVSETWSGQVSGAVTRSFDNNFWLIEEQAAGHTVVFDYDDDGLLTAAGDLTLARDPDNGLISGSDQGDTSGTRAYNAFGELMSRDVEIESQSVYRASYSRDAIGRIDQQTLEVDGLTDHWRYEYDQAGRLVTVERNGVVKYDYVYDANGNRIEYTGPDGNTITADYDEQDRLLRYGDTTYTHTEAGERLTKTDQAGTIHYDYDAAGNLREVILPDGTVIEYLIDGRNRRVGKKVDGELQNTWIYRDQLSPVAQFDGEGNLTHRFVYAEKAHSPSWMVRVDPATGEEAIYRIISDHLGSVRLVVEIESGALAQQIEYGPFGQVLHDSDPGLQPFGFAGGLYDRDVELLKFGARDYDPRIGRWTAKDPIDFAGGDQNLFTYVGINPINNIDPAGLYNPERGDPGFQTPRMPGLAKFFKSLSANFGGTGSIFVGVLGFSGSTALAVDSELDVLCSVSTLCVQCGLGFFGGGGAELGGEIDGPLSNGTADSFGFFANISPTGAGAAGGGSINFGEGSVAGTKGIGNVGGGIGASGGVQFCRTYTVCPDE